MNRVNNFLIFGVGIIGYVLYCSCAISIKKYMNDSIEYIPINKTPRYVAECEEFEEWNKKNPNRTGLLALVAPGPRDWLKPGETWDDLHKEIHDYYYEK